MRPLQEPRSLLFYGSVTDFCHLDCQRRFVAEFFARPVSGQPGGARKRNECSTTSTNSGVVIAPTF